MTYTAALKQLCWSLLIVFPAATSLFAQSQSVSAAMPQKLTIPPEAQPSAHFDAEAATNAYLAEMPAEARARSDGGARHQRRAARREAPPAPRSPAAPAPTPPGGGGRGGGRARSDAYFE